jgi:hypothetical protein
MPKFDPRVTGISVRNRQYFPRPNYTMARMEANRSPLWNYPQQPVLPHAVSPDPAAQFYRRNSFTERTAITSTNHPRPLRCQSTDPRAAAVRYNLPDATSTPHTTPVTSQQHPVPPPYENYMPYNTLDPLLVEDPLSEGNNVGRNAFRIFQVQRAFSDAHRALVAALEWDMHSTGELRDNAAYPLLKCLLQNEDMVCEV